MPCNAGAQPYADPVTLGTLEDDPISDSGYAAYPPINPGTRPTPLQIARSLALGVNPNAPIPPKQAESMAPPMAANVPTDCSDVNQIADSGGTFPGSFQLSPNFTLARVTTACLVSNWTLQAQNGLTQAQIVCNLKQVALNILEPIYAQYSSTMRINSGFRHTQNGHSQHELGQAVDISFSGLPNSALYDRAREVIQMVPYNQFILEYGGQGWLHISYGGNKVAASVAVMTKPFAGNYVPNLNKYA